MVEAIGKLSPKNAQEEMLKAMENDVKMSDVTIDKLNPITLTPEEIRKIMAAVPLEKALDAAVSFQVTGKDDKGDYIVKFADKDTGHMATATLHRDDAGHITVGELLDTSVRGAKEVPAFISSHSDELIKATKVFDTNAQRAEIMSAMEGVDAKQVTAIPRAYEPESVIARMNKPDIRPANPTPAAPKPAAEQTTGERIMELGRQAMKGLEEVRKSIAWDPNHNHHDPVPPPPGGAKKSEGPQGPGQ